MQAPFSIVIIFLGFVQAPQLPSSCKQTVSHEMVYSPVSGERLSTYESYWFVHVVERVWPSFVSATT